MARFTIYSPNGVALYEGTPTFTGQYMKPGLLEFREVALSALVDLVPGCYVDYTRTGHRYRIYTVPQLKKQARSNSYGGAFVYQSVQLYDASKMLEYCPFRDLVTGDNRIHFSTQPSISTFEGCDGLARRFEACLQDQYGTNSWAVRIATQAENPNLYELMLEPREFTVSGMNILECLNKVYEIWPEVGWIYKVENGKDTIVIGGGGLNPNEETYAYGKGFGLTSLTRVAANAEEIANRIFAYGSSRNMLPRWYNNQDIKDAESVDIQNLMIPVSEWGLTDGERDAAKAYVEDDASIAKNGLRPATVYFDGKGEYPEIYPTLRETTIAMVRTALGSSSAQYYPSTAIYADSNARVDKLLSAQSTFDSGLAGNTPGKANVEMGDTPFSASGTFEVLAGLTYYPFYHYQGEWTPETAGIQTVAWRLDLSGQVQIDGIERVVVSVQVKDPSYQGPIILASEYELTPDTSGVVALSGKDMYAEKVKVSAVTYTVFVDISVYMTAQETDKTGTYTANGNVGLSIQNYRKKTFTVSLRQLGFDINEQSAIGDGKTIAMRTGDCVGRSFAIKSVQYNSSNDCWDLECWRTEDESLSQWFPNSQFKVKADDEFVLLDIAMPDIYVRMAEQKLLTAANDLLDDSAVERWQYTPEIDAKYMVENGATIRAGEYMSLLDIDAEDITPTTITYFRASGGGYFYTTDNRKTVLSIDPGSVITAFVDTVTINEGESAIPTYKVTLRDRKKKTWTESQSLDSSSNKSVGSITTTQTSSSSGGGDSFFQLDESGNVTLKPQYQNLWVRGWLAAGGIGDGSEGGVFFLRELYDVYHNESGVLRADGTGAQPGDSLIYNSEHGWVAALVESGGGGTGTVTSVTLTSGTGISVSDSGTAITTSGTRTISISSTYQTYISHGESAYNLLSNYATVADLTALSGRVTTLEGESFFTLDGSGNVTLKANYSNLWVPGWMAAGGTGSGSSGGGVDLNRVWDSLTNNTDKPNVKINVAHIPDLSGTYLTSHQTIYALTLAAGSFAAGTYTPNSAVKSFNIPTTLDHITDGTDRKLSDYVTLHTTQTIDGEKTFMTNPVTIGSTSSLSVHQSSHIDIGPVRIEYDSATDAIHITTNDSTNHPTISLYADGFVAAGGARQTS